MLQLPKYTLPHVCERLGVTIGQHHDAGDNARVTIHRSSRDRARWPSELPTV